MDRAAIYRADLDVIPAIKFMSPQYGMRSIGTSLPPQMELDSAVLVLYLVTVQKPGGNYEYWKTLYGSAEG